MATDVVENKTRTATADESTDVGEFLLDCLKAIASLRLTVALFVLAIFIILVGTLAQVRQDMWEVMEVYFKPYIARIDEWVLFPRSWFPNLSTAAMRGISGVGILIFAAICSALSFASIKSAIGRTVVAAMIAAYGLASAVQMFAFGFFWTAGGGLIGLTMVLNLLAAHAFRFKVRARGMTLAIGLVVILLGVIVTAVVIISGHNQEGLQDAPPFAWTTLWQACITGLLAIGAIGLLGTISFYAKAKERKIEFFLLLSASALLFVAGVVLLVKGDAWYVGDSGMRILWQLIKSAMGGVVLLIGCAFLFRKRAGVVLLHAGVLLLMFGQWFVTQYDVEEQMTIEENKTASFGRDIRTTELAIVRQPDDERAKDQVVVIPRKYLLESERRQHGSRSLNPFDSVGPAVDEQGTIDHELLPFKIEVLKYYKNAMLDDARIGDENLATKGQGLSFVARDLVAGSGTDMSGEVDIAAAYVRLRDKQDNSDLGVYLLAQNAAVQGFAEKVSVDGKDYYLTLRFKRNYKDYSITLLDVRKDDYIGTSTPRNYSSDIRLVDPTQNEDREIHIWMNNPLRYAGETFYQSGYNVTRGGLEVTTLQVVRNQGWMIPYVACVLVGIGLVAHFVFVLIRFLGQLLNENFLLGTSLQPVTADIVQTEGVTGTVDKPKPRGRAKAGVPPQPTGNESRKKQFAVSLIIPVLLALTASAWLWSRAQPPEPSETAMNLNEFGKLPVVFEGRIKPYDTLARNSLRVISTRSTFKDATGQQQPAIRWLLDVISGSKEAEQHRVIRIDNRQVLETLGLKWRKEKYYSVEEIYRQGQDGVRPEYDEFNRQVKLAREMDKAKLKTYQRKLVEVDDRIRSYTVLVASFQPLPIPAMPTEEQFQSDREGAIRTMAAIRQMLMSIPDAKAALDRVPHPLAIPLPDSNDWEAYATAENASFMQELQQQKVNPATILMRRIMDAYVEKEADDFNQAVAEYRELLAASGPTDLALDKVEYEWRFNHYEPFYLCIVLYVAAFVLTMLAWMLAPLGWHRPLLYGALALLIVTFFAHSDALLARMFISGRPPVTNLYSSAIFIGWGAALFGIVLEIIFRLGFGTIFAALAGFSTLFIAHNLAGDGDTFTVLQAVLDTQFWLATHVVCVTFGYAATFLAGIIGIHYVLIGMVTPFLSMQFGRWTIGNILGKMLYGVLCFAILFSFIGTVLGGLWADDSWGRFWGWDPKENGALIIVLWNAVILHARWGGLVRDRGLAVLSIVGNIVTAWSWFGVNELGVGLHSYGFTEGVLLTLAIFIASQLTLIALGSLPKKCWWSFRS